MSAAADPAAADRTYGQWWDSTEPRVTVALDDLRRVGEAAYQAVGASADMARFVFDVNLDKALQGDHARGLGNVPGIIAEARAGRLDVDPEVTVVRERAAAALVDGGPQGWGRAVCCHAVDLAVDKARAAGVGFVAARGSGEILTPFVRRAADAGMVGLAMVQSVPTVAPLGGFQPLLGNAPLAIAVPAGELDPFVLDMSFTESSASGVLQAAAQGQQVPEGALLDERGRPTRDACEFPDPELSEQFGAFCVRGTLRPLGGGHKGFAMVYAVGLLTALLADASPPWDLFYHLPERGRYGTLLMAVDPTAFTGVDRDEVGARVDGFLATVKAAPRQEGVDEILYPGERSQRIKRARAERGVVTLPASHLDGMVSVAVEAGVAPPTAIVEPTDGFIDEPTDQRTRDEAP